MASGACGSCGSGHSDSHLAALIVHILNVFLLELNLGLGGSLRIEGLQSMLTGSGSVAPDLDRKQKYVKTDKAIL